MGDDDFQLSHFLSAMWNRDDGQRPGPKRGLDLRSIGAACVEVADAEGFAGVSMAKVAKVLGVTTMALYRYVASKDELNQLMLDTAYGPVTLAYPTDSAWSGRLLQWAAELRRVLVEHPWIVRVPISEPPLTPHQIGWMEVGLGAFQGTPLTSQDKLSALLLVDNYVRGVTQLALDISSPSGLIAAQRYQQGLATLADPDNFPELASAIASGALDDDDETEFPSTEYRFGLDTVVDGIAVLIDRRIAGR